MAITQNWHEMHKARWMELLKDYKGKPSVNFLEIGSYEGNATVWCMQNILTHDSSMMTCIDPWLPLQHYANIGINMDHIYERFMENVQPYLPKLIIKRGYSIDELKTLPLNHYDMVYVDGLHTSLAAHEDAVLSFPLLKSGGYMIFDDYEWQNNAGTLQHPKEGIDTFVTLYRERIDFVEKKYQVIIRKK